MKHSSSIGVKPIWPFLAVCPALIAVFAFALFPGIMNLIISVTDYSGNPKVPFKFVGLFNYKVFFTMNLTEALASLKVTFIFSFFVVVFQQILSVFSAVLVNMKLKLSNFYRALYFLPSILGVIVIGLTWNLMFDPNSGIFAYILNLFGKSSSFLGDTKLALPLVILVTIWANFGFAMTIYLAGLQSIPQELYESGDMDGAGSWNTFRYITLPMLGPAITVNLWISISGTLNMYDLILVLTNGGPGITTQTFYLFFFKTLTNNMGNDMGLLAAMSILWFIIISTVMLTFNYFFRKKEVEV